MPDLNIQGYPDNLRAYQVTIAAGASASEIFATQGWAIVGIEMPAAWTAANIGYKSCMSGNVDKLKQVYDNGSNPEVTQVAASHNIAIPQSDTVFAPFMQLISVSTSDGTTPVVQVAAASITLLLRKYLS